jgi:hypothetical protein
MVDVVLGAGEREGMATEERLLGEKLLDLGRRPAVALGIGEVRAVVGEHCVDAVRDSGDQPAEEVCRNASAGALMELGKGELELWPNLGDAG